MIIEDYTLENCIRKDSCNVLYLTSKKYDPKKYLTKAYDRQKIEQTNVLRELRNEIIMLGHLKHPNIIILQDWKKSKKSYYIIYEYCNGGNLSQALEKYIEKFGKPFPEGIVQHLMLQIIDAFKYLHKKRIIHRDINLDNILLQYESEEDAKNLNLMKAQIKIIKFHYAIKYVDNSDPFYWDKPDINSKYKDPVLFEHLNNKKIRNTILNLQNDIWSIGCICYEMLTGKQIFCCDNMDEFMKIIEKGIYHIPISLSFEAISFINGILQYDIQKRFSAEELSKYDFLIKDANQFKKIDFEITGKINSGMLEIDIKNNSNIFSIFNKKYEILREQEKESKIKTETKNIQEKKEDNKISGKANEDSDLAEKNFYISENLFD